ncbi:MAG: hypothetical protein GY903_16045 [Fuerstiella sp.]|nr:hypothetical protein [Fuerstiella sp.]MCP4855995.1 hypothetical protein [Fuerstiella sp.]
MVFLCSLFLSVIPEKNSAAEEILPVGAHPAALETPHFPDRLHAFVWRNWQLVEPQRLAGLVGTATSNIKQIAASMGLPEAGSDSAAMLERGYITLIRRNWHLLPYDQLLTLLDMTPEELAHTLREDDFLYIKLGRLKPKCEPLRYQKPNAAAQRRAAEIKQVVERHFGDLGAIKAEPRFHFVETLSSLEGTSEPGNHTSVDRGEPLRMVYSYFGLFGDPLADPEIEPIPDGLLARLAEKGVNGIWMHVVLRQLAPGGEDFPEFGQGHENRLRTLKKLVAKAKRYGIGIYLYMNEPRAMPPTFFENRPELAGIRQGDFWTLCTSQPQVRKWLSDSLAHVFGEVRDLGGVFTITASENLTNCASHGQHEQCERCRERTDAEIIAEVNTTIKEGVHRGSPKARVIAWDWGWKRHGDAPDIISLLPKDISLMSVSEWSLPIERGGVKSRIGEYSISAVGPGPRATKHWAYAKQAGLKTVAKVAFNNTWELSAVPFIPVMDLIAEHSENLQNAGVDGTMLSWTLGGYPSPNLLVSQYFSSQPGATRETVLTRIAQERYGNAAAPDARRAWTAFSDAFRNFPYSGAAMYRAPQQIGPANLLYARPTSYASTMVCFPYDHLAGWRGPYPAAVFAEQFEKITQGWAEGIRHLEKVLANSTDRQRDSAESDLSVARAVYLHFASVANQVRFVMARDAMSQPNVREEQKRQLRKQLQQVVDGEISLARELFFVASQDSRIGYEASNHYFYVPLDLVEKVINCEFLRDQFEE